jgi:hypothetical protein
LKITIPCKICGFPFEYEREAYSADFLARQRAYNGCFTLEYCAQMDFMKYAKMVVENERRNNAMGDTQQG